MVVEECFNTVEGSLRTQTYFRRSRNDRRKYVCVRRLGWRWWTTGFNVAVQQNGTDIESVSPALIRNNSDKSISIVPSMLLSTPRAIPLTSKINWNRLVITKYRSRWWKSNEFCFSSTLTAAKTETSTSKWNGCQNTGNEEKCMWRNLIWVLSMSRVSLRKSHSFLGEPQFVLALQKR